MLSSLFIKILLLEYIVIMIICLYEHNWVRVEYWLGALLIVHATLRLK